MAGRPIPLTPPVVVVVVAAVPVCVLSARADGAWTWKAGVL